jgi:uncharacterized membrane protein (DUF2068 family)
VGFLVIGVFKLVTAVLLVAAGLGVFRLMYKDVGEVAEHYITRLHLDPDNRLIHWVLSQVSRLDQKHLKLIGLGTFFYAFLHVIEGTGLILRRNWAGYLTVIITSSALPLEVYEVAKKPVAMRIAVLVVNLGIVIYLVVKLVQEHRARTGQTVESSART